MLTHYMQSVFAFSIKKLKIQIEDCHSRATLEATVK